MYINILKNPDILFTFFLIFQTKFISISTQNNCKFTNCLMCLMCGSESNTKCNCEWDNENNACIYSNLFDSIINEWYDELSYCDSTELSSTYCSTKSYYTKDDLVDDKIVINLNKDSNNKYGQNFIYCYYEFVDENQENSYYITINYSSGISIISKPVIAFSYSIKENNVLSENYIA